MGSNLQFNLTAGLKAVEAWQQNIARNAQGLLVPGFNRLNLTFGASPAATTADAKQPTASGGSQDAKGGGADSLLINGTSLSISQGDILPADSPTALAIKGQGFFIVAENLNKGAKLYVTRSGDFHYDAGGRLVNSQGLFVVGGSGNLSDPPAPVLNPGDGSVPLASLTLGRVPVPNNLALSGFGPQIYQLTTASGTVQPLPNGQAGVGFVQTNSLEYPNRNFSQTELLIEASQAAQTYKMFKEMLDDYNKMTDDAVGLVH
jgi:flagellar hook protein FlgE